MDRRITLAGLDCGSTTSCLVMATGEMTKGVSGRVDITDVQEFYRSELVFTPFEGNRIDCVRLQAYFNDWFDAARIHPPNISGGGALITGLAAQRENAAAIRQLLSSWLRGAVFAAAGAPRLESWLTFMGNCHDLSLANPQTPILNLDLGGGTTNLALGLNGEVLATGSLHVGARHFRFEPGGYRIVEMSPLGAPLLDSLSIRAELGDTLSEDDVAAIVRFYVAQLVAAIEGTPPDDAISEQHVQIPLELPAFERSQLAITLSGGVGELVYRRRYGHAAPAPAEFGDLGGELAHGIIGCPAIADRLSLIPSGWGRATVLGLMRYSTQLSGSTLYLPHPERLPLGNVPIIGCIDAETSAARVASLLCLAAEANSSAALQIELPQNDLGALRTIGELLATGLAHTPLPPDFTLVLLVEANLGKALGNYVTRWATLNVDVVVIDELPWCDAQFVHIGQLRDTVVPVSLYAAQ